MYTTGQSNQYIRDTVLQAKKLYDSKRGRVYDFILTHGEDFLTRYIDRSEVIRIPLDEESILYNLEVMYRKVIGVQIRDIESKTEEADTNLGLNFEHILTIKDILRIIGCTMENDYIYHLYNKNKSIQYEDDNISICVDPYELYQKEFNMWDSILLSNKNIRIHRLMGRRPKSWLYLYTIKQCNPVNELYTMGRYIEKIRDKIIQETKSLTWDKYRYDGKFNPSREPRRGFDRPSPFEDLVWEGNAGTTPTYTVTTTTDWTTMESSHGRMMAVNPDYISQEVMDEAERELRASENIRMARELRQTYITESPTPEQVAELERQLDSIILDDNH